MSIPSKDFVESQILQDDVQHEVEKEPAKLTQCLAQNPLDLDTAIFTPTSLEASSNAADDVEAVSSIADIDIPAPLACNKSPKAAAEELDPSPPPHSPTTSQGNLVRQLPGGLGDSEDSTLPLLSASTSPQKPQTGDSDHEPVARRRRRQGEKRSLNNSPAKSLGPLFVSGRAMRS